jgi:hypothetical protein
MQKVTQEGLLQQCHAVIDSLSDPVGHFDRECARISKLDENAAGVILETAKGQPKVALGMLSMYLLLEASEKGAANATT